MMESYQHGLSGLKSLLGGSADFYSPGSEPPREKGTYVLVLKLKGPIIARAKRGPVKIEPGIYAYVGSAYGSGGLRARILRHWRRGKKKHWHIDWITTSPLCKHVGAFVFLEKRIESEIARQLEKRYPSVPGFGASDSQEDSHLFRIC